jgi:hypothetical protein
LSNIARCSVALWILFKSLDRKTSNVIRCCSGLKIDFDVEEEVFDMCKAFEDYKNLGKSEVIAIGKNEGLTRFAAYLIKNNVDIQEIISQTGFSADDIMKIKNSLM